MLKKKKVLVCITPQSNSVRLIDKAHEIAVANSASLHILHVEKGHSVFLTPDSTALLQSLFNYGSELGGIVHGLCGEDIVKTILDFVKKNKITNIVLGQPPEDTTIKSEDVHSKLMTSMPYLEIFVLNRETILDK